MVAIILRVCMLAWLLLGSAWGQVHGAIDMRPGCDSCSFHIDSLEQPFNLRGNWLFTRDDRPENKDVVLDTRDWKLVKAPGPWKAAYSDGKNYRVGWYRATLEFAPQLMGQEVLLLVDTYIARTSIYLDGRTLYQRPTDANTGRLFTVQPIPVRFTVSQPRHVVVIRVDTPNMLGIYQLPLELRRYEANDSYVTWYQLSGSDLRLITAVIGSTFGLFWLLVYAKTRFGMYLHAALASLFCSLYMLTSNDFFLRLASPESAYLLGLIGLNCFYFFFRFIQYFHVLTPWLNRLFGLLVLLINLMLVLMLFHLNIDLLQPVRTVHFLLGFVLGVFIVYMTAQASRQHRVGARVLLAGFVLLFASGTNDMLLGFGLIDWLRLIPLGMCAALASVLYVTGHHFANTFADNQLLLEKLRVKLEQDRNYLENQVEQRTHELREAIAVAETAQHAAESANRMKSEFLAMISHEIRTPLGGVIGMLKLGLKDNRLVQDTRGKFGVGLSNAESLLQIINDILDYSKLEAGKMTLECIDFDLHAVVQDSHSILQERAEAKGLELRMELAPELARWWRGDPVRLRQVLINLMGNAIKFTEKGQVCITVALNAAGRLIFTVRDTGIGIAPEALPRLFQKFEQADVSTTRKFGGTGLGLAICKSIVEAMGGTISVNSTPGVGATFRFGLPLQAGQPVDVASASASGQHTHRLRILCAEDGTTNQLIIRELIESMGHTIDIAEDGQAALEALARQDYDLVLMDSRMPRLDGLQALRLIRQGALGVRDATIPVVALTANVGTEERERFLASGADGFLGKPILEKALHDEISHTIALLLERAKVLDVLDVLEVLPPHENQVTPTVETASPEQLAQWEAMFPVFEDSPAPSPELPATSAATALGFSPKIQQAMRESFIGEAPRLLQAIQHGLDAQDAKAVAMAAHRLKGSSGYFDASELFTLCQDIEALAKLSDLAAVSDRLDALEAAVAVAVKRTQSG